MKQEKGYFITAEIRVTISENLDLAKIELKKLETATLKEEGCDFFYVHQNSENPTKFIIWEKFKDEVSFKKHFEYEHSKKYLALNLTELVTSYQTHSF